MLKAVAKKHIIDNVLRPHYDAKLGHKKFSVLVLDKSAMEVVNSCLGLNEVFEEGITLVEDLTRNREPMSSMDAIYIVTPVAESVDILISDFTRKSKFAPENLYKTANIYFLETCCDELFDRIAGSPLSKYAKALMEINLSFKPIESQVFTVSSQCKGNMTKVADGIASLCSTLNINPTLRFHSDFAQSAEICYRIDQKLKETADPKTPASTDAELIVMDRSFDLVTPLLHETTLQAMACDLTDFRGGIYRFKGENGEKREIPLDEKDDTWMKLRHKHLSEVLKEVHSMTKELKVFHEASTSTKSAKEVSSTIRQLPEYLKKKAKTEAYLNLTEECRSQYFSSLEKIILLEQDMALEHTPEGSKVSDTQAVNRLSTFLMPAIPLETRLRLILIFMLTIGKDKDEQYFNRLLHHTDIPEEEFHVIRKMLNWRNRTQSSAFQRRRPPPADERFSSSRWDPKIRNIIQEIHEKRLDEREFKFLGQKSAPELRTAMSARYGGGLSGRPREKRKIILFIVGGITYSEMRTIYEMSAATNTTIILGSDYIITPSDFLQSLRDRHTTDQQ